MKPTFVTPVAAVIFTVASLAVAQAETKTLHYPTQDASMFSIDAPADWKVTEIEEVGGYGSLESENGSILQFRAVECESEEEARKEVDSITGSTPEFLQENYTDIQLQDAERITIEGRQGAQLAGSGKDKEGNNVEFLSAFVLLTPTTVAEIWAVIYPEGGGDNDLAIAKTVLDSFKPTGSSGGE